MSKITFILGGARSGKSRFAAKLAKEQGKKVAFIATCQALDKEMEKRIVLHRKTRPGSWQTFEEPREITRLLKRIGCKFDITIIDCLTLLVSNLLLKGLKENEIERRVSQMFSVIKKNKGQAIIVSNEVGLSIVPQSPMARQFRDLAGRINQIAAGESDNVFFMVSGLPLKVK